MAHELLFNDIIEHSGEVAPVTGDPLAKKSRPPLKSQSKHKPPTPWSPDSSVLTRRPPRLCPYRLHNLLKSVPGLRDPEGKSVDGSHSLLVLPFNTEGRTSDRIGPEGGECHFAVP